MQFYLSLLLTAISAAGQAGITLPVNLAGKAEITASSEHSDAYRAKNVADGIIPSEMGHDDTSRAWCVNGSTHGNGADLSMKWSEEMTISEVVYFGRTAWQIQECWKNYSLFVDGKLEPVAEGQFKMVHGPQRILLQKPVTCRELLLKFSSSYGGSNPGASEIMVFPERLSDDAVRFLGLSEADIKLAALESSDESKALAGRLYSGGLGFNKMVMIQRHAVNATHVYTYHQEGLIKGGGLHVLEIGADGGKMNQIVDSSEGIILDCNISYDGGSMLFSWKKTMDGKFQIYTINVDGTGLKQVADHDSNNFNACWLPDGGIAFLSDRKPAFAYCWITSTPIIYRCDRDGGNLVRLSANYLNDFTPAIMDDGRIIYSRWEYVDRPAIPIQSLWTMNQDGTGLAGYFGNRVLSPATFMEAAEIPGTGKVLCVLTSHNGPCRGAIGIIDPARGANAQDGIRNLTPEIKIDPVGVGSGNNVRGPYESPFPVDDKYYLVSKEGTIQLRDYGGTAQVTIVKGGGMGYYTARPVMPRKLSKVRPTGVKADAGPWATVMVQDVYNGLEPHVKRGEVKQIAVVQEIEKSVRADLARRAFGFQFPVVSCGATYAPKKVWGYAKVEEDGSAHFNVPAGVPIYFIALDEYCRGLQRMRTFTHLMPGERQSCVGCHANRNYATPRNAARPIAALRPAEDITVPEWGVKGFSFAHIVQPVLDKNCVKCHNAEKTSGGVDLSPDKTDFFNVAYETLARRGGPGNSPYTKWIPTFNGMEANILLVEPKYWGSPASLLAKVVLSGHPDENKKPRITLSDVERRRIFAWIDLDVPYYGTSESNHYQLIGCRQMIPSNLDEVLEDVRKRRCADCHEKIPRPEYTRITNIGANSFLAAPLAREEGGAARCKEVVFASKNDPDYKAILAAFEPTTSLMTEKPRKDMEESW